MRNKLLLILIIGIIFVNGCDVYNKMYIKRETPKIEPQPQKVFTNCLIKEEISYPKYPNITYYNGTINQINYIIDLALLQDISQQKNKLIICGTYCGNYKFSGRGVLAYENCYYMQYYLNISGNACSEDDIKIEIPQMNRWEIKYKIQFCCVEEYCTELGEIYYESYMQCDCKEINNEK